MNKGLLGLTLMMGFLACGGCTIGPKDQTWIAVTENGDKPGIALLLTEKDGRAETGKLYVLDPNHPRDLSQGVSYVFRNLTQSGKTITGDVLLVDESSPTKEKNLHLSIVLKGEFAGGSLEAEVQEGSAEKETFFFQRK
jgi:hypothetical protein